MTRLMENLPFGMAPLDVLMAFAGLSAALMVVAIWMAMVERDPMAGKARSLADRRNQLRSAAMTPRRRENLRGVGMMRRVVKRLNLLKTNQTERLTAKLARAGYRSQDAIIAYLFGKVVGPIGTGLVAAFLVYVMEIVETTSLMQLLLVGVGAVAGIYAPDLFVKNQADKRADALRKSLPDGLDLMVICAEAGLSLDATMHRVARELARTHAILSDELALTAVELGFLPERRMALMNLAKRCDMPAVRGMVNTLLQTEKYGTPLSQSLRVLSIEMRNERLMKAEEKAARLPAIMTVPLIMFILPALFVVLMGPAALSIMDNLSF
jgi:tight adherence protein C